MIRLHYQCELLTDVVMVSKAATEGFHDSLNYIPGSKFLGIAAKKLYDDKEQTQRTLDLFHNGCVRFGDAHPMYDKHRLLVVPLTWEKEKYPKSSKYIPEIFLQKRRLLNVNDTDEDKNKNNESIKKTGFKAKHYFQAASYQIAKVGQGFSLKSAYDAELRRSEDARMFGYYALKGGTVWHFSIEMDKDYTQNIDEIFGRLGEGREHSVGRSKTAEYGRVKITQVKEAEIRITKSANKLSDSVCLYAESNLCFYDKNGNNTTVITPELLGLSSKDTSIDWLNSQIRTRSYRTWNAHRRNRDGDRTIITKGSVITLQLSKPIQPSIFEKGIGAHRSEGFGKVLANPTGFKLLGTKDDLSINAANEGKQLALQSSTKVAYLSAKEAESKTTDELVKFFVKAAKDTSLRIIGIEKQVDRFWQANKVACRSISNSQWGQLRRNAKTSLDDAVLYERFFNENFGMLCTGLSAKKWEELRLKIKKEFLGNNTEMTSQKLEELEASRVLCQLFTRIGVKMPFKIKQSKTQIANEAN